MACCAFAAILIGQILLVWGKLRAWLGRSPAEPTRSAAEWRFGDPVVPNPAAKRRVRTGAVLVALGIAGVAGPPRLRPRCVRTARRHTAELELRQVRAARRSAAQAAMAKRVVAPPANMIGELTPMQLTASRYLLDRALQDGEDWDRLRQLRQVRAGDEQRLAARLGA